MRAQASDSLAAWPDEIVVPHGVLTLIGYGLDVRVWRGRLRVADGIGKDRREAIVHRATGGLRRLVVLGHTGSISLEAIRWLADVGAGFIQIDADGRVLAAFGPQGADRPMLRRRQALALDAPAGVDVARRLIGEKVAAQAETLVELSRTVAVDDEVVRTMREAADRLHVAASRDDVRVAEGMAAAAYWSAWSEVRVRFAGRDAARVPAHWRTFGARSSPLTGSPRLAGNPANALLNYLYALLEGEATLAARVVGLDPALGVLHSDQLNRASLAADLMEPVRPLVDRYVLGLLRERTFPLRDFYETRQGVCRVTPPLTQELAATAVHWGRLVGRVVEDVTRWLDVERPAWERPLPTPLSGRNRSAGRGAQGHGGAPAREPRRGRACLWCGAPLRGKRQTCPGECEAATAAERDSHFVEAGTRALATHRHAGTTVQWTPELRQRAGAASADRIREARAWQREGRWPSDPAAFAREVLPALGGVATRELARRAGLAVGYCSQIKKGRVVPHPMWWERLAAATEG